jgi:hypothetical protein
MMMATVQKVRPTTVDRDDVNAEWMAAEQILSTLREPAEWFEAVSENVQLDETQLSRILSIKISSKKYSAMKSSRDDFFVVLLKPRKGTLSSLTLGAAERDGNARLLSHREHIRLARLLITFRFMSIVQLASDSPVEANSNFRATFPEILNALLEIPDIDEPHLALRVVHRIFAPPAVLSSLGGGAEMDDLVGRLRLLCVELAERYYKVAKVRDFSTRATRVDYSYQQMLGDRSTGGVATRLFQRLFRAPSGVFLVHVPLARLTDHYEFRMSQIRDRYVLWQRIVYQDAAARIIENGSEPQRPLVPLVEPASRGPWVGRAPGRVFAPHVFIGEGTAATGKLFVGVRYEEIPPGASATALIAQLPSAVIAVSLVWWSLTHQIGASVAVAGVLAGLLGVGNIVADERIASREVSILNAPLLPRAMLLLQSALMVVLTLWLLVRGTSPDLLELPKIGILQALAQGATSADGYIGLLVAVGSIVITLVLLRRWARAQATFARSGRFAAFLMADRSKSQGGIV